MDEAQAYRLAARAIKCVGGSIELDKSQQLVDSVVAFVRDAYKIGFSDGETKQAILEIQGRDKFLMELKNSQQVDSADAKCLGLSTCGSCEESCPAHPSRR